MPDKEEVLASLELEDCVVALVGGLALTLPCLQEMYAVDE